MEKFPTDYNSIVERLNSIEPERYGKTRNFIDGAVTRLSPYISRGIISTKFVLNHTLEQGYDANKIKKFVQELAWRDYWQQIWKTKGDEINTDLKRPQPDVTNNQMPKAILEASTGIHAIDKAIENFYKTGYLHNHVRMYLASITCNIGKSYWKLPAKWMYYHLLDADWASNGLSWQWVAGSNSHKKYYANQENINKYMHDNQRDTFLDVSYEKLTKMNVPSELSDISEPDLSVQLPGYEKPEINPDLQLLIYNFYNLDPNWKSNVAANRILLLEPSFYEKYPVSDQTMNFILELAKNIEGIQIFTGEFDELVKNNDFPEIIYKEHPTSRHYKGTEESRDWIFPETEGYYPSFFNYWKKGLKNSGLEIKF